MTTTLSTMTNIKDKDGDVYQDTAKDEVYETTGI
jgi:hypothetical protein